MFVTLVSERSFLCFSTRKEQLTFTNRDDSLQDLTESKEGVYYPATFAQSRGGEPCLISTPERVTYDFSVSEPAKVF